MGVQWQLVERSEEWCVVVRAARERKDFSSRIMYRNKGVQV